MVLRILSSEGAWSRDFQIIGRVVCGRKKLGGAEPRRKKGAGALNSCTLAEKRVEFLLEEERTRGPKSWVRKRKALGLWIPRA